MKEVNLRYGQEIETRDGGGILNENTGNLYLNESNTICPQILEQAGGECQGWRTMLKNDYIEVAINI